jgi:hypothetical protein
MDDYLDVIPQFENSEEFLNSWLKNAYDITFQDENFDQFSEEEKFLTLGQVIFELPDNSNLMDVVSHIMKIYKVELSEDSTELITEYYLVHALSDNCYNKSDYVCGIMTLEKQVQEFIMDIIRRNINSIENEIVDESPENVNCKNCIAKDVEINNMKLELSDLVEKLNEDVIDKEKLKDLLSKESENEFKESKILELEDTLKNVQEKLDRVSQNMLDSDMQVLSLSTDLARRIEYTEQLEVKHNEVTTLYTKLLLQSNEMRDELDILRPKADRTDGAEIQLDKLRSKLEELQEIKNQLKTESVSHNATFAKMVDYEIELEELRKLKNHMDEYRTQNQEYKLSTDEMKIKLDEKEHELNRMREENEVLAREERKVVSQAQSIEEELKITLERLRELERVGGVGDGMSELNPTLMGELYRLRVMNKDLQKSLENSAIEMVEELRRELTDEKIKSSATHAKWIQTQCTLEKSLSEIDSYKNKLNIYEKELQDLKTKDIHTQNNSLSFSTDDSKTTYNTPSTTAAENEVNLLKLEKLQKTIQVLEESLKDTRLKLDEFIVLNNEKDELLMHARVQTDDAIQSRIRVEQELINQIESFEKDNRRLENDKNFVAIEVLEDLKSQMKNSFEGYISKLTTENIYLKVKCKAIEVELQSLKQNFEAQENSLKNKTVQLLNQTKELSELKSNLKNYPSTPITAVSTDNYSSRLLSISKSNNKIKRNLAKVLKTEFDKELGTKLTRGLPSIEDPFLLTDDEIADLIDSCYDDDGDNDNEYNIIQNSLKTLNKALIDCVSKKNELFSEIEIKNSTIEDLTNLIHKQDVDYFELQENYQAKAMLYKKTELEFQQNNLFEKNNVFQINDSSIDEIKIDLKNQFELYINDLKSEISNLKKNENILNMDNKVYKQQLEAREVEIEKMRLTIIETKDEIKKLKKNLSELSNNDKNYPTSTIKKENNYKNLFFEIENKMLLMHNSIVGNNEFLQLFVLNEKDLDEMDEDEVKVKIIVLYKQYLDLINKYVDIENMNKTIEEQLLKSRAENDAVYRLKLNFEEENVLLATNFEKYKTQLKYETEKITNDIKIQLKTKYEAYINELNKSNEIYKNENFDLKNEASKRQHELDLKMMEITSLQQRLQLLVAQLKNIENNVIINNNKSSNEFKNNSSPDMKNQKNSTITMVTMQVLKDLKKEMKLLHAFNDNNSNNSDSNVLLQENFDDVIVTDEKTLLAFFEILNKLIIETNLKIKTITDTSKINENLLLVTKEKLKQTLIEKLNIEKEHENCAKNSITFSDILKNNNSSIKNLKKMNGKIESELDNKKISRNYSDIKNENCDEGDYEEKINYGVTDNNYNNNINDYNNVNNNMSPMMVFRNQKNNGRESSIRNMNIEETKKSFLNFM